MSAATSTLKVESDRCVFVDDGQAPVVLLVSPRDLAQHHWPHAWPGPLQLERAIDEVENAIEAAGLRHAVRGWLNVTPPLAQLLPDDWSDSNMMSRDLVESAFSQLAASASGARPAAAQAARSEAAGALLLVREVLHHLGLQGCIRGS